MEGSDEFLLFYHESPSCICIGKTRNIQIVHSSKPKKNNRNTIQGDGYFRVVKEGGRGNLDFCLFVCPAQFCFGARFGLFLPLFFVFCFLT